jgi:hypothetical protein
MIRWANVEMMDVCLKHNTEDEAGKSETREG